MPTPMPDRLTIELDEYLPHPPARVWRALTDPLVLARWLMPNDFKLALGHRFTFRTAPLPHVNFDGVVHCEVLAFEPEKLLRISWCGSPRLQSTVTWRLEPAGSGTRLHLEHTGFDPDDPVQRQAHQRMDSGWRTRIMAALRAELQSTG